MKRLWSNSDAPWQYIPKSLLADVGGTELFKCNYDYNHLDLDNHLPASYKQIIFYWQEIATATPKNKSEVLSQPIWNNRFLTVNKKMIFFPHWYQAGIEQISDLSYSCEGHFLPFNSFCNKFNVNVTFYNIIAFFLLFPKIGIKYCKKVPKTQLRLPPQSVHCHARQYTVCSLTFKIYLHQLLRKKHLASGVEKNEKSCLALLSLLSFWVSDTVAFV